MNPNLIATQAAKRQSARLREEAAKRRSRQEKASASAPRSSLAAPRPLCSRSQPPAYTRYVARPAPDEDELASTTAASTTAAASGRGTPRDHLSLGARRAVAAIEQAMLTTEPRSEGRAERWEQLRARWSSGGYEPAPEPAGGVPRLEAGDESPKDQSEAAEVSQWMEENRYRFFEVSATPDSTPLGLHSLSARGNTAEPEMEQAALLSVEAALLSEMQRSQDDKIEESGARAPDIPLKEAKASSCCSIS